MREPLQITSELEAEFSEALKKAGLIVSSPTMDGKLYRVPVEGAKHGKQDGAYIGYLDGMPNGRIENFKKGEVTLWQPSKELRAELKARPITLLPALNKPTKDEIDRLHENIAERVTELWERFSTMPPDAGNSYLLRKQVNAYGVRFTANNDVVVPLRDIEGKLWSLQTIYESTRDKRFIKGGKKLGNMHLIGTIGGDRPLLICEGYSTGASLYQATGLPVAIAVDSGNIIRVAQRIKAKHSNIELYIMGDNDAHLLDDPFVRKNVGLDKASEAAEAHNIGFAVPDFTGIDTKGYNYTDFNDLHLLAGLSAVKEQVEMLIARKHTLQQ